MVTITLLLRYSKTTSKLFREYNKKAFRQGQKELGNEFALLPGRGKVSGREVPGKGQVAIPSSGDRELVLGEI